MTDYTITSSDAMFSGLENALKIHYGGSKIQDQCYANHPFLGMLKKKEDLQGLAHPLPLISSPETGTSHSFSVALASANSFAPKTFFIQTPEDYAVATLSTKAMLASKSNAGAFLDLATGKIDQALAAASRRLSLGVFRSQTGIVGKIASISTGVVTLEDRGQVVAFEVGQKYVVTTSAAPTSSSNLKSTTDVGYVIAVDRAAGTVTFSGTRTGSAETPGSGGTAFAANDYLIPSGDVGSAWHGLSDLIPSGTPGDLWGVVRTADRQRLAGTYLDRSTATIQEALIDLGNSVCEAGIGAPSHVFMNYASFGALLKEIGAKTNMVKEAARDGKGNKMSVSYEGLELYIPSGRVVIVPDRDCISKTAFMLDMERIALYSYGPAVQILDGDGLKWLRQADSDGMAVRVGGFATPATDSPGAHGRATLSF